MGLVIAIGLTAGDGRVNKCCVVAMAVGLILAFFGSRLFKVVTLSSPFELLLVHTFHNRIFVWSCSWIFHRTFFVLSALVTCARWSNWEVRRMVPWWQVLLVSFIYIQSYK